MNNQFDDKAKTWDTPDKIHRAQVFADKIAHMTSKETHLKALEYGSGTGLVSFCLKEQFKHITLMDTSEGMLDQAKQKISDLNIKNIEIHKLDLTEDIIEDKYDVIYSLMTLHHIQDTKHILTQFYNHLNPNGKLFIADLDSEDGAFHGAGFNGHNGFDRSHLYTLVKKVGYTKITIEDLIEIERPETKLKYQIFMLSATKE